MSALESSAADTCQVSFRRIPGGLRAHVTGTGTFANTVSSWRTVLVEVRERKPATLLLVDELRGPPLSAGEWHDLVEALRGQGLENVRIAHVKPRGLQSIEYCEIYAREAEFEARVFDNETTAGLWLRYGAE